MTPAMIYTAVRDFLVVAAIAFVAWRVYTDGQNSVKASDLKSLQNQVEQQGKINASWHQQADNANTRLRTDIAGINSAPVVMHDWVRSPASCPEGKVLSGAPAKADGNHSSAGGIQPGSGGLSEADRRDAITADFKRYWETKLAECRAEDAQWPLP